MKHLSLFTGIGGFDLGFEAAGFETVAQVEYDRFCNRVLERHWPDIPRGRDIADFDARGLHPAVVTFGSPCQDLSVAGRRAGLGGSRSGLFFEATRVISECRPTFAVWENVPGAFSSNDGRDFLAVLVAMEQLGATDIAWRIIDSQYAGVPQQRRRIYLVADFGGQRAGEVLFESEGCGGHPAPGGEAREGPARTLRGRSHGAGGQDADRGTLAVSPTNTFRFDLDHDTYITTGPREEIIYPLDARMGKGPASSADQVSLLIAHALTAEGFDAVSQPAVFVQNSRSEVRLMRNHGAVAATQPGETGQQQHYVTGRGMAIRRFTPTECERLQGFPDGWTCLCGSGGDMFACRCPDGPRYRALGNACTTTVPEWIARRLAALL